MRWPTNTNPTVVGNASTTTTIITIFQGSKNNSYKGKTTHNNGPKVQCKFCFGPREIFQIWKLLEEHANNPDQYMDAKAVKSYAEFIKNRTGNSAHINEIELEALAELMDHPIKHVIYEINMFAFSEIEEANKSHLWLGKLKSCYDPSEYYKDTETNSHVHKIYTTTTGYDTGIVFPIQVNGRTIRALLDTGAERSCMNMDTYEKLKLTQLNTSFIPTLKGATSHDMLAKGITTFDFTINEHTFTNSFIVCTKMSRPIILGRDFTIPNCYLSWMDEARY